VLFEICSNECAAAIGTITQCLTDQFKIKSTDADWEGVGDKFVLYASTMNQLL